MNGEINKQNDLILNDDGKLFFNPYNQNNIEITEKKFKKYYFHIWIYI